MKIRLLLLFLPLAFMVTSQEGSNSSDWTNLSYHPLNFAGPNGLPSDNLDRKRIEFIDEFPDGSILVVGGLNNYNAVESPRIIKLNPDGTMHDIFASGFINDTGSYINGAFVLPNGNIFLSGRIVYSCSQEPDGECFGTTLILNPDGSLNDYSTEVSITSSSGEGFAFLLPDGKILVNGDHSNSEMNYQTRGLTRLNADGSVDYTFADINTQGLSYYDIRIADIAVQSDGKILGVGDFEFTKNGHISNDIFRLNPDGTYDSTFTSNLNDSNSTEFEAVKVLPDDSIFIGGAFYNYNDQNGYNRFVKLDPNGVLDTSFSVGSFGSFRIYDLEIQNNDKIIVVGNFNTFAGQNIRKILRFNLDGTLDMSYNHSNNIGNNIEAVHKVYILNSSKVLFGGDFTEDFQHSTRTEYIARTDENGLYDASFNPVVGCNDRVDIITKLSDGDFMIGGKFEAYNGYTRFGLAKINSSGAIDEALSFDVDLEGVTISQIIEQPDGKILVSGFYITSVQGVPRQAIFRLNQDFSLDLGFQANLSNNNVETFALQPDGKIVLSTGERLLADGSLDTSFPQLPISGSIESIEVQDDGKIICVGQFYYTNLDGVVANDIIRVNNDGTIDPSFDVGTGTGSISYLKDVVIRPDGKLLLSGSLVSYKGASVGDVILLHSNGDLDTSFVSDPSSEVTVMQLLENGKVVIGGKFGSVDGHLSRALARLNANGSTDTSFITSSIDGTSGTVNSIAFDDQNNLIIGGNFTEVNNYHKGYINKIVNFEASLSDKDVVADLNTYKVYPNPVYETLNIQSQNQIETISIYDINGRLLNTQKMSNSSGVYQLDVQNLSNGVYFLDIQSGNSKTTMKFVKK